MRGRSTDPDLKRLAQLYGVQTAYTDVAGERQQATEQSLRAVLRSLGVDAADSASVSAALDAKSAEPWLRGIEPVVLAPEGGASSALVRLPTAVRRVECIITLEDGEQIAWEPDLARTRAADAARIEGTRYTARQIRLPENLPVGYHAIEIQTGTRALEATLLVAPPRAHAYRGRHWGAFLPLYALRAKNTLGNADLSDLEQLRTWVHERGGSVVGTLPLLASFLDEPFEPSPYAPASRLFWNELYVDPRRAPELQQCRQARGLLESEELVAEARALAKLPTLEYERAIALRRRILEALARCARETPDPRFRSFARANPHLDSYARFRAAGERYKRGWPAWPDAARRGRLTARDYDDDVRHYHAYVQWLAHLQLEALKERTDAAALYLDLPIGVHRDGYDVWRYNEIFVLGASAGAPPDTLFTKGQNWGFPPLHPERLRASGYVYFRESLANLMRYAGLLRLDHVMGLYRLFFVPEGHEATDGAYVHFNADELFSVLAIESARAACAVIGEDLGTVPREVRTQMRRHGVLRMHVVQFVAGDEDPPIPDPPVDSVASLNTHDMPTFAAFWEALDVADRVALGLLDEDGARDERAARARLRTGIARFLRDRAGARKLPREAREAVRALLVDLARGPEPLVLINLEDLWLEELPQNVPGTWRERPNWRRKARYTLEQIDKSKDVAEVLDSVSHARALQNRNRRKPARARKA